MIDWPADLITAIARRRSVLFLGAGVSMNSINANGDRPPSWEEFLREAIERCPGNNKKEMRDHLKSGDFLTCCQLVKYRIGAQWVNLVEEFFLNPQFKPHKIHEHIFGLDSSIVLTPNFDKIYDNYALSATSNLLKIKKYYDDDIARSLRGNENQRLIVKIHGCIDTPDKLVFTREDYSEIRHKHANFYRAIDALIVTHTFLFIGCGMNDPDLALLLEQYARSFCAAPPHYLLMSRQVSKEYETMLRNNYNVILVPYSPKNNHEELTESLGKLGELVDERREALATSRLW
ncbi:MAG: SIR2 family protein [Bacteroidales bacterium]